MHLLEINKANEPHTESVWEGIIEKRTAKGNEKQGKPISALMPERWTAEAILTLEMLMKKYKKELNMFPVMEEWFVS